MLQNSQARPNRRTGLALWTAVFALCFSFFFSTVSAAQADVTIKINIHLIQDAKYDKDGNYIPDTGKDYITWGPLSFSGKDQAAAIANAVKYYETLRWMMCTFVSGAYCKKPFQWDVRLIPEKACAADQTSTSALALSSPTVTTQTVCYGEEISIFTENGPAVPPDLTTEPAPAPTPTPTSSGATTLRAPAAVW